MLTVLLFTYQCLQFNLSNVFAIFQANQKLREVTSSPQIENKM